MRDDPELETYSWSPPMMADGEDAPGREEDGGGTGVAEPPPKPAKKPKKSAKPKSAKSKPDPKRSPPGHLPPYRVLLHDDPVNTFENVILSLLDLTPLDEQAAFKCTLQADREKVALVLVTHKERAELYVEQFKTRGITLSIEPAE
jgi:ATP-dependent Clp protease adaptor protein ClpS